MIQELDGGNGFVISSHGAWLPGVYATRRAAQWAFQFSDYDLAKLRDRVGRPITSDDLRERLIVTHATDNRRATVDRTVRDMEAKEGQR